MKKVILTVIAIVSLSVTLSAQSKEESMKELLEVMNISKMIEDMMAGVVPAMQQQMASKFNGEEDQEKFKEVMAVVSAETTSMTKKLVDNEMVNIYSKHFEVAEIQDLITFYRSSTGKKLVEKTPVITTELTTAMMSKYMPEFQKRIQEKVAEMKK